MVIIFQKGEEFWIEMIHLNRQAISSGTTVSQIFDLERPGHFLGMSGVIDTANASREQFLNAQSGNPINGQLTLGIFVESISVQIFNNDASTTTSGANIVIFMRK